MHELNRPQMLDQKSNFFEGGFLWQNIVMNMKKGKHLPKIKISFSADEVILQTIVCSDIFAKRQK